MTQTRRRRLAVLIPVSLAFYLILLGSSWSPAFVAQAGTPLVTIVPNASTLTTTAYSPDVITVVIGVNNTVLWTNDDDVIHTATGTNFTEFNTGNIEAGATVSYTFNTPGTYPYHCIYHTGMVGKVIVKAAAAGTSTGGGGIPEFPYQLAGATAFVVILVASYLLVRRHGMPPHLETIGANAIEAVGGDSSVEDSLIPTE